MVGKALYMLSVCVLRIMIPILVSYVNRRSSQVFSRVLWQRLLSTSSCLNQQQKQGHYTPITKQLWIDRIAAAATDQSKGDPVTHKPPEITRVVYPLSVDGAFKEHYRNPWNFIRIGCILEDLDSLAGNVAFQHCARPGLPAPLLVTASVDQILLHRPISIEEDVTVTGKVAFTGTSSLDIQIQLWQQGEQELALAALFSFVHLDPVTKKPSPVVQLLPGTEAEKKLAAEREAIADARRAERKAAAAGRKVEVSAEAMQWQAKLLKEARALLELPALAAHDAVPMAAGALENTFITQPQQQNMHGRVFGGFLMRRAFELAFATTYAFAGARPAFVMVDEVSFKRPVDIGDLLRFKSRVIHTAAGAKKSLLFVEVEASVAKPELLDIANTNTFIFVFTVQDLARPIKRVLPTTAEEAARAYECHQATDRLWPSLENAA